mmetsp:Transcript_25504/g.55099  ORF Transcript_25504/g.55099 Transcript_25504/m.55099 type:complete len:89 (-) Transcript_25504:322-588(-)
MVPHLDGDEMCTFDLRFLKILLSSKYALQVLLLWCMIDDIVPTLLAPLVYVFCRGRFATHVAKDVCVFTSIAEEYGSRFCVTNKNPAV